MSSRSSDTSYKSTYEKKVSHPPVTYRTLTRTGARSRDPSPIEKDKDLISNSSYNYNRLYPTSYSRSVSRERTEPQSTTIPKYTGRLSSNKDDATKYSAPLGRERTESTSSSSGIAKYTGRTSISKDEPTKYHFDSKGTTIPKYTGRLSSSKDDVGKFSSRNSSKDDLVKGRNSRNASREDLSPKYKPSSIKSSHEDLTKTKSYITSRFLPKNSVEKSYNAYSRPMLAKSGEISRKNRELLNSLNTQNEDKSRSVSRCSSEILDEPSDSSGNKLSEELQEMETVDVITRSTSPNPPSQVSIQRTRRMDVARTVEKQLTRPKYRNEMVDKEVQSDRLDDSTKSSRFAGPSRISATPWSSFLDLKYSSPSTKTTVNKTESNCENSERSKSNSNQKSNNSGTESPQNISRSSSGKSLSKISISVKSKTKSNENQNKKQLPPQIPKLESTTKSLNKDFRKSVLNMNPETVKIKKTKCNNSTSSGDSETSEATEVSENLPKCKSFHNTSSSAIPLNEATRTRRSNTRSPSVTSDTSTTATSSSEDDVKRKTKSENKLKKLSGRGSAGGSSADEMPTDHFPKPPLSPRSNGEKSQSEAKSFLMRALAPMTNLFKNRHQDGSERADSSSDVSDIKTDTTSNKLVNSGYEERNKSIKRIDSGERAWWLSDNSNASETAMQKQDKNLQEENNKSKIKILHRVESGEKAWWLEPDAEIPEGIEVYPVAAEEEIRDDERVLYKIRKNDSTKSMWWLENSDSSNRNYDENTKNSDAKISREAEEPEFLKGYKIRHIDSGERAWWLSSNDNIAESVEKSDKYETNNCKFPYKSRHFHDDEEKPWWMKEDDNEDNDSDVEAPLGDRASPEGLEMPKDEEFDRLSPYDNVPRQKSKRPNQIPLFISKHTNIDDILGGTTQLLSPLMDRIFSFQEYKENGGDKESEDVNAAHVRVYDGTPQRRMVQPNRT